MTTCRFKNKVKIIEILKNANPSVMGGFVCDSVLSFRLKISMAMVKVLCEEMAEEMIIKRRETINEYSNKVYEV